MPARQDDRHRSAQGRGRWRRVRRRPARTDRDGRPARGSLSGRTPGRLRPRAERRRPEAHEPCHRAERALHVGHGLRGGAPGAADDDLGQSRPDRREPAQPGRGGRGEPTPARRGGRAARGRAQRRDDPGAARAGAPQRGGSARGGRRDRGPAPLAVHRARSGREGRYRRDRSATRRTAQGTLGLSHRTGAGAGTQARGAARGGSRPEGQARYGAGGRSRHARCPQGGTCPLARRRLPAHPPREPRCRKRRGPPWPTCRPLDTRRETACRRGERCPQGRPIRVRHRPSPGPHRRARSRRVLRGGGSRNRSARATRRPPTATPSPGASTRRSPATAFAATATKRCRRKPRCAG